VTGTVTVLDSGIVRGLRRWAAGLLGLEAAVELLLRASGGRFGRAGCPWIRVENGCVWLDPDLITPNLGGLSGGERRTLAVVDALASGRALPDLSGVLAGLDRASLELVIAAMAHAAGSHSHSELVPGRTLGSVRIRRLPPLVPWPEVNR
jgi:hypothetical protein